MCITRAHSLANVSITFKAVSPLWALLFPKKRYRIGCGLRFWVKGRERNKKQEGQIMDLLLNWTINKFNCCALGRHGVVCKQLCFRRWMQFLLCHLPALWPQESCSTPFLLLFSALTALWRTLYTAEKEQPHMQGLHLDQCLWNGLSLNNVTP